MEQEVFGLLQGEMGILEVGKVSTLKRNMGQKCSLLESVATLLPALGCQSLCNLEVRAIMLYVVCSHIMTGCELYSPS